MKKEAKQLQEEINRYLKACSYILDVPIKPVVVGYTKDSLIINGGNYSEDVEYGCVSHTVQETSKDRNDQEASK